MAPSFGLYFACQKRERDLNAITVRSFNFIINVNILKFCDRLFARPETIKRKPPQAIIVSPDFDLILFGIIGQNIVNLASGQGALKN